MRNWILTALTVLGVGLTLIILALHPPRKIVMAAGPVDGAYYPIAVRYRDILARDKITVEITETAGSVENADLLDMGKVDVAILQGGIRVRDPKVEAIGAIFFEPMLFLSSQQSAVPGNPARWRGLRIASGAEGSGTRAAFRDFEQAVGLKPEDNQHIDMTYSEAVSGLRKNQLDVAVFVAPLNAPYLLSAYFEPAIRIQPLDHIEAISRLLDNGTAVTLPAGAIALDPVIPFATRLQLALQARLAVSGDLHPALVNRLTMAAIEIHSGRNILTDHGKFPSVDGAGMPVNDAARQLILNGPTTWHDWLPYWMAAQVNRLFLLMLPILFILLPLLRSIPIAYAFVMRWRVWQHYPEIRLIEDELALVEDAAALTAMEARLRELDDRLSQIRMPPAYRQTAYDARLHIDLVRSRIDELRNQSLEDPIGEPATGGLKN